MPCFNHARFLKEAADSVLRQTHTDLELVIIDDCSLDNSWEVMTRLAAADSRVELVRHEFNQGLPKSRNDGLQVAKGDLIAFCDADDVWETGKLTKQVALLQDHPSEDVVYCDTFIIDGNSELTGERFSELYPLPKTSSGWLFQELINRNFINVQSALMRRRLLESVHGFDEDLGVLEDWWYWIQLSRTHRFLYSPEPLARYRVHSQSMNAMKRRSFPVNRIKIYRRMLRKYPDLSRRTRADIAYYMGMDLRILGKRPMARRLLWNAVLLSATELRGSSRLCKAMARLIPFNFPLAR